MPISPQDTLDSLVGSLGLGKDDPFQVRSRGRPERSAEEASAKKQRVLDCGAYLKSCRVKAELNLSEAARRAGLSSAKLLDAYERTCFPPGEALIALAGVYRVPPQEMALAFLRFSQPAIYQALSPIMLISEGSIDEA